MIPVRLRLFIRLAPAILLLGGCEKRDPNLPALVPFGGVVTLDNAPLSGAQVTFLPTSDAGGTISTGVTDAQGKYALETMHNGVGAPVGEFKVLITKIVKPDGSDFPAGESFDPMSTPHKQLLAPAYSDPEKSKLTATVPAGGGTLDFPLKSKP